MGSSPQFVAVAVKTICCPTSCGGAWSGSNVTVHVRPSGFARAAGASPDAKFTSISETSIVMVVGMVFVVCMVSLLLAKVNSREAHPATFHSIWSSEEN
jgi:hypothetical protein